MKLTVEVEQETDGRWMAEVLELPGALAYGTTRPEGIQNVRALALRVIAERLEHGEAVDSRLLNVRTNRASHWAHA